ncbi:hypothetical protein DPMN_018269 [Dreissena polymorpha]|uniref:Uncharacterized protein n=1 Tax=Dreissena polymorpha TaxID=45954 RepID=A0A9D4NG88_DREPO|nr:hypothetical protein DPMN_018269 [Dreissena polymorpha]
MNYKCNFYRANKTGTIFERIQDIIKTNVLTKCYEDCTINEQEGLKGPNIIGGHVFEATKTIFELIQVIIKTNLLTKVLKKKNAPPPKFHEDRTINVASRVLTRFYYSHIRKNAPPLGSHVFQANVTIFELIQGIIGTNLLTKFYDDRKNKRKMPRPCGGHVFQPTGIIF